MTRSIHNPNVFNTRVIRERIEWIRRWVPENTSVDRYLLYAISSSRQRTERKLRERTEMLSSLKAAMTCSTDTNVVAELSALIKRIENHKK